ncbi:SHOCT domain-containing protein [Arthrobacter liuii]|uniref:Membrane protein n=1 Tax=Arthrobacter liuii TaxID=1476996 RepID=A0ABQ2AMG4_9MICC|nr:SHOCT domain-containing protein [Arthrobacter liuii]GGH92873.1 membrane protein [Arthrobacter liuii]
MNFWENFWDFFWVLFWSMAFFAYLIVLFQVVVDLFRDATLPGWSKALWVICCFFLPFLTVIVYLLARGPGMAVRQSIRAEAAQDATESYVRTIAGTGPAEEITKAKSLLEEGAISEQEFTVLKNRALAGR